MARLPEISYIVGDGYRGDDNPFARLAVSTARDHERYGKPFFITEYGGAWHGTSEPGLEADLHCGIWATYMTSAAATPLLWWFDFIDRRDLYWHYRALANFARGEDRRDKALRVGSPAVVRSPPGRALKALSYAGRTRGYAWVYATEPMARYPEEPVVISGARVRFDEVADGPWRIEYWDTVEGVAFRSELVEARDGKLEVALPEFRNDVALKLRREERALPAREEEAPEGPSGREGLRERARTPAGSVGPSAPRPSRGTHPLPGRGRTDAAPPAPRSDGPQWPAGARSRVLAPGKGRGDRSRSFVRRWALIGPFAFDPGKCREANCADAVRRGFLPDEADLVPKVGRELRGRKWRLHDPGPGGPAYVNLRSFFVGDDHVAAYAAAELRCERDLDDLVLLLGSDDYHEVYLNGRLVHRWDGWPRGASPDQDRVEGLRLRKGPNSLVLKCVNVTGGWGFYARLETSDGRPLEVGPGRR
jgi:hypothetical protein